MQKGDSDALIGPCLNQTKGELPQCGTKVAQNAVGV